MIRPVAFAVLCLVLVTHGEAKVTPVTRVVDLMKKLLAQVESEDKTDRENYDKFACFCRDTAQEYQHKNEQTEKRVNELAAKIKMLEDDIKEQEGLKQKAEANLKTEEAKIAQYTEDIAQMNKECDEGTAVYDAAIDSVRRAIAAIQGGKTDLLEIYKTVSLAMLNTDVKLDDSRAKEFLEAAAGQGPQGQAATYKFQSQKIIDILRGLEKNITKSKDEFRNSCQQNINLVQESLDAANRQKDFETENIANCDKFIADYSAQLEESNEKHATETQRLKDDAAFLKDLTKQCEDKAASFDKRNDIRTKEMTALKDAVGVLVEHGADANYESSNKKTSFLANKAVQRARGSTSFVQVAAHTSLDHLQQKAFAFIGIQARKLQSTVLKELMMQITMKAPKGAFDDVVKMIDDLIEKLNTKKSDEDDTFKTGNKKLKACQEDKDQANADLEAANSAIRKHETEINEAKEAIAQAEDNKASLEQDLAKAIKLRAEDSATNKAAKADAEEGLEGVQEAIKILNKFYDESFIQEPEYETRAMTHDIKGEGVNFEGKTVKDLAPATWNKEYEGKFDLSKGVVGLLEVIERDFQRTVDDVNKQEEDAEKAHQQFVQDTNKAIDDEVQTISDETTAKEKAEGNLSDAEDAKKQAEKDLKAAEELMKKLTAEFVTTESWEERDRKRNDEIKALKEALKILRAHDG